MQITDKIHLKIDIVTSNPVLYYYIPLTLKKQIHKMIENHFGTKFGFEMECGNHTDSLKDKVLKKWLIACIVN